MIALLPAATCALAQTYTYKLAYSIDGKKGFGGPATPILILDEVGYGSGDLLYQATPNNVRIFAECCSTNAALVNDSSGNLYGVEASGNNNGGVLEFIAPTWTHKVLYRFTGGADGKINSEYEAPLAVDPEGNLWSTTWEGGTNTCNYGGGDVGCGVIYELVNNGGTWTEQVIYDFTGSSDGSGPAAGLTYDTASRVFYGTTTAGGDPLCQCGTIFELSPNRDGGWTETTLYAFASNYENVGGGPRSTAVLDAQGNLYGTTYFTGVLGCNCGEVWEFSRTGQFSVLWQFNGYQGSDGAYPSGVIFDANASLWGTTYLGGKFGSTDYGTIFNLTQSSGSWQYSVFHVFASQPSDGAYPLGGVSLDSQGNLWGTTSKGGKQNGGTFFEVAVAP